MKFDLRRIDKVDRDIAPPFKECITIPAGDPFEGVAVYVASGPFTLGPSKADELKAIARLIGASDDLLKSAKAAWHLCQSLLACRDGATDELIREIAEHLHHAITKAEEGL